MTQPTKHEILFSQIREDPAIEQQIINRLDRQSNFKVLMIASGGCTSLSVISSKISQLDLVDSNREQLYLTQLKFALCQTEEDSLVALKMLNGGSNNSWKLVINALPNLESKKYWNHHQYWLNYGPNRMGKFEELFRQLRQSNFNFDQQFETKHLIDIFGESAVVYSLQHKFSDHFRRVLIKYKNRYLESSDNYFYNSIVHDDYSTKDLPIYLRPFQYNQIRRMCDKINYYHDTLLNHLRKSDDNYYDFIQTSNLTDWQSSLENEQLIKELYRCLKPYGVALLRRLNGDIPLHQILGIDNLFKIEQLDPDADRSHFYSQIIIITSKKTTSSQNKIANLCF